MLDEFQGSLYLTYAPGDGYSIENCYPGQLIWFRMGVEPVSRYWNATMIAIPYWPLPLVVLSLIATRGLIARAVGSFQHARTRIGHCYRCGYDLRADT